MQELRVEITDNGHAIYLSVKPDRGWQQTTRVDDLITVDWDQQERVIGVELIGSAAREALNAWVIALGQLPVRNATAMKDALAQLTAESGEAEPPEG